MASCTVDTHFSKHKGTTEVKCRGGGELRGCGGLPGGYLKVWVLMQDLDLPPETGTANLGAIRQLCKAGC